MGRSAAIQRALIGRIRPHLSHALQLAGGKAPNAIDIVLHEITTSCVNYFAPSLGKRSVICKSDGGRFTFTELFGAEATYASSLLAGSHSNALNLFSSSARELIYAFRWKVTIERRDDLHSDQSRVSSDGLQDQAADRLSQRRKALHKTERQCRCDKMILIQKLVDTVVKEDKFKSEGRFVDLQEYLKRV